MSQRPFAWEASYPPGLHWDAPLRIGRVTDLIEEAVREVPDRIVLHYRDWSISYAGLQQRIDRFAASLIAGGLGKGSSIALLLPNSPYHPIAFFGALKAGARVVHLSPLDAQRELAHKLTDSGARTLITTNIGGMADAAMRLLDASLVDRLILGDDSKFGPGGSGSAAEARQPGIIDFDEFCRDAPLPADWPEIAPDDIALLQYTGGTTGMPKGAMLSHANLTSAVSSYDAWFDSLYEGQQDTETILCALPLFHIYALTTILLLGISRRAEIVLHLRFDADRVLDDIETKGITSFPGVPTMWIALANRPDIVTRNLSGLKRCSSGGAPLPVEVGQRFETITGMRLVGGWGMTETAPAGTNLLPFGPPKPGSIGLPLPGVELQIVSLDDPHRVLGTGETGELRVRGTNVTSGYWNRPEESAESFADGFFLTGDVGYMAEDGYFYIVDRKKDMIISGGFNVYPQMIEQAIYEHPAVGECIVIGLPHPYRGEAAQAYVTLKQGACEFTLEELNAFLADKLGRHEMPASLQFRGALPRTSVGKLSRRALRDEELSNSHQPESQAVEHPSQHEG